MRLFSYLDTQKSRLGTTNFHQIPINAPKCPFHNFQRDGMMQTLVPTGRANYEPNSLDTLKGEIEKAGGTAFLVAPKIGGIKVKGGTLKADGQLAGSPSVLFDAVASILMPDQAENEKLTRDGAAIQWFVDSFGHCKTIAHSEGTKVLLDKANVVPDEGVCTRPSGPDRRHAEDQILGQPGCVRPAGRGSSPPPCSAGDDRGNRGEIVRSQGAVRRTGQGTQSACRGRGTGALVDRAARSRHHGFCTPCDRRA